MYEPKTTPTTVTAPSYLAAIEDDVRRKDCEALASMMERVTGCKPRMWGSSIVGFDSYHYQYASGHEGDAAVVGFSARKGDISVYLVDGYDSPEVQELLARLGRHKVGKSCLYLRRLADIDMGVLEQMVIRSVAVVRARYPTKGV